ncbi:MAG: hypothetical protein HYV59_15390 [Planctomycetes bacterium]|nr:hypothetical protein [Planctomycetota bacterium]
MLKSVRGYYKNGKFELYEKPQLTESEVIMTFVDSEKFEYINLLTRGITKEDAQDLKNGLRTFEEDWNAKGMELYDKL